MNPHRSNPIRRSNPILRSERAYGAGASCIRHALGLTRCAVAALLALTACSAPAPEAPASDAQTAPAVATLAITGPAVITPPPPGLGVLTGRVVDAFDGVAVADAEVVLHGRGRRIFTAPDGRFRFDGVDPGPVRVFVRESAGYAPRSVQLFVGDEGVDLGIVPVAPLGDPVTVVPEYGGVVPGCGATQLAFATEALPEPQEVALRCLERPELFPAAPPAGRLPLAVIHSAPAGAPMHRPPILSVQLPDQPRYGPGVPLDLFHLDPDSLTWAAVGTLEVDGTGTVARGTIPDLGSYLVASPPFGALAKLPGALPRISGVHTADRAGGEPDDRFDPGTEVVYLGFEYSHMVNTSIEVVTVDEDGEVLFEAARPYSDAGQDFVPMLHPSDDWPPGEYETSVAVLSDRARSVARVAWQVRPPDALNGPATLPPPAGITPLPSTCRPPSGWYPYRVRAGDTLSGLAAQVGLSVSAIQSANCLASDQILIGQVVYVPRPMPPPAGPVGPFPGVSDPGEPAPTKRPGPIFPQPTTWYTPPPGGRPPATATPKILGPGPEPTLAPRPTLP